MQIRSDPPPRKPLEIDFAKIPLGKSSFIPTTEPRDLIRRLRHAAKSFRRHNPTSRLSIHLVRAPGQIIGPHDEPVGVQVWHLAKEPT